jgi:copper chaperone CopZ
MSYYCHITPGRLRIKTPIIKQNPIEIERVRELLHSLPGVDAVSINALTGSVTINHSGSQTDAGSILNVLEKNGYYKISQTMEQEHPIETVVSKVGTTVGRAILGAAVEKVFEGSMLSLLALLV